MKISPLCLHALSITTGLLLVACSGGSSAPAPVPVTYGIGGKVAGLASGESVVLNNNGANALTVTANGAFTFPVPSAAGANYAVTVATQPLGQSCVAGSASGSDVAANITGVTISCTAATETVLHSFAYGPADGGSPTASLTTGPDGNFYGVTSGGGANGTGTVFSSTPAGVVTILHSFGSGQDGMFPESTLLLAADGNFYGTTNEGGANSMGTIFKISPAGVETVVYSFSGGADGSAPSSGLIEGSDGNFYGTTVQGGTNNAGTVYKLTPAGVESVIHTFGSGQDGAQPLAGLVAGNDGNFYGTTFEGGAYNNAGTVFKITPAGVETVLHSFGSGQDASTPEAALVLGSDGNFFGTTSFGGIYTVGMGAAGTVFKITPAGVETVLHSFGNGTDGVNPFSGLVAGSDGNFYGTTSAGGVSFLGVLFKITPSGAETVLYSFATGSDAQKPSNTLAIGKDGYIYGLTSYGGVSSGGTMFRF